jgi:hypothetical protein
MSRSVLLAAQPPRREADPDESASRAPLRTLALAGGDRRGEVLAAVQDGVVAGIRRGQRQASPGAGLRRRPAARRPTRQGGRRGGTRKRAPAASGARSGRPTGGRRRGNGAARDGGPRPRSHGARRLSTPRRSAASVTLIHTVIGSGSRTHEGPDHGPSAFSVEVRALALARLLVHGDSALMGIPQECRGADVNPTHIKYELVYAPA